MVLICNREFEVSNLYFGNEFDKMLSELEGLPNTSVNEVLEIAYLYRDHYSEANALYNLALNKSDGNKKEIDDIKIYMLGLKAQHNMAKETDFYELNMVEDNKFDLLKGFYFYSKQEYNKAYAAFSKIPYLFGMNLSRLGMNEFIECIENDDNRLRCYSSSRYWEEYKIGSDDSKDFLYRINKSDSYDNEDNIDVILTNIENELRYECATERLEEILRVLLDLKNTYTKSSEILYLVGKIYHIMDNFDNAKECYIEALKYDENFLPAKYNLSKITGEVLIENSDYTEVNDIMALLSIKNKDYGVDLSKCSDFIRKVCKILIKDEKGDKSVVFDYQRIIDKTYFANILDGSDKKYEDLIIKKGNELVFEIEAVYNNLAILLDTDKKRACELLEYALSIGSAEYEDFLKYNLGLIGKNKGILESLDLKQAKWQLCVMEENTNIDNSEIRAHMLINTNLEESENILLSLLSNDSQCNKLYVNLCLGCINIDKFIKYNNRKFLSQAKKYFMKDIRSFYSINGLGIIAYLDTSYDIALNLFEQIVSEYTKVHYNISACYMMKNDYKKAMHHLIKYIEYHENDLNSIELLKSCCSKIRNINDLSLLKNSKIPLLRDFYENTYKHSEPISPDLSKRKASNDETSEYIKKISLG